MAPDVAFDGASPRAKMNLAAVEIQHAFDAHECKAGERRQNAERNVHEAT